MSIFSFFFFIFVLFHATRGSNNKIKKIEKYPDRVFIVLYIKVYIPLLLTFFTFNNIYTW